MHQKRFHFVGRSWQDKVEDMRTAMTDESVDMLVVTGLDETACKLEEIKDITKRARDVAFNMIVFYEQFESIKSAVFNLVFLSVDLCIPFC